METILNNLYKEIAATVNEMIPEQWEKFWFYAQVSETGGGTYFYYNTPDEPKNYKYSLEVPFIFTIDEDDFTEKKRKLFDLSEKLREVFKENDQELWYSFTLSLERTGKLNISFDYTDWFSTDYSFSDQQIIWKHKYLGEEPSDTSLKGIIEKYKADYPENPI
ncbi:antitoxin YezG family protein [Bacillus mojavensis]|uniref:antitoxin YezG family protein n=1 Tax=Bacillus mojavensis TaxID=72360 RepID=UPI002DBA85B6|nr:antitoxin YezG family protein [Bacillus mojavensis]MEC1633922.1 antitoxin YezG family protein [Bacillus mojavensis]